MASSLSSVAVPAPGAARGCRASNATAEPAFVRRALVAFAVLVLVLVIAVPVTAVFVEGLRSGTAAYAAAISEPEALSALRLTALVTVTAVSVNLLFGLAAGWAIAKFTFPGKNVLLTLIDLPLAVSPVVSGLVFVLVFGRQGWMGPWLQDHGLKVIFAAPGIVLATVFVTFPMIVREVVPVLEAAGTDEEEAAMLLGASGWQIFRKVTLPNVKWGVLYGVILCGARAMGEFGAVSVVSGHVRGQTNTLPLHVEILYNEYHFQAAFAVASILTLLAFVTIAAKKGVEWRAGRRLLAVEREAVS
jgi:sulfate transport system permease protein